MVNLYLSCTVILLLSVSLYPVVFTEKVTTSIIAEVLRQRDSNVIFSPLLVTTGLWQLYLGAEGETLDEISKVLQLEGISKEKAIENHVKNLNSREDKSLNWANSLFVDNSIKILPQYQKQLMDIYSMGTQTMDFSDSPKTVKKINDWVAINTKNKITKIIDKIPKDLNLMLLGAIHFKKSWKYEFNKRATRKDNFHIPQITGGSRTIKVDMMFRDGKFRFNTIKKLDATSLELPYDKSNISMVILLPKLVSGIDKLIANLNQIDIDDIVPKSTEQRVKIHLPKFKFDVNIELNNPLKRLGLVNLFENAILTAMIDSKKKFHINEIIQKAVIEVNEEGSEAAAAQGTRIKCCLPKMPPPPVPEIHVDHPFVFIIKEKDLVYFAGRVAMK